MGQNPMFAGLVGASVTGGLLYVLRDVPVKIGHAFLYCFTREITVRNDNVAFDWIERWLAKSSYASSPWCRILKLSSEPSESIEHNDYETRVSPGYGYHLMWRGGYPLIVDHWRDSDKIASVLNPRGSEGIRFRLFFGPRQMVEDIVSEAYTLAKQVEGRIPLYLWLGGWWQRAPALRPRDPAQVYLPDGAVEAVLEDAVRFTRSHEWYKTVGVPYRRGYLFAGESGTGKTTLAITLASYLKRPLYSISLANIGDMELSAATLSLPGDAIFLLEDIDTVAQSGSRTAEASGTKPKKEDGEPSEEPASKLTLGGLLNALDGIFAGEGRILIMTTNHPEKLDTALLRPGRADYRLEFKKATGKVIAEMFRGTFGDSMFPLAKFEALPPCSPATVQNALLAHRDDPEKALEALQ